MTRASAVVDELVALAVLIVASIDVSGWLGDRPVPPLGVRAFWWIVPVIALVRLCQLDGARWIAWLVRRQAILIVMLAIAVVSSPLSLLPMLSLQKSVSLAATTFVGVYIGSALTPTAITRVLSVFFGALIAANLASLAILPAAITVEPTTHHWRGVMDHKNSLGAFAAFALAWAASRWLSRERRSVSSIALFVASGAALILSHSVTSLIAAGAGLLALAWMTWSARVPRTSASTRVVMLASIALAAAAATISIGPLTRALGRDVTFNGRAERWLAASDILRERPLTGFGYQVVWGRQDASLLPRFPATTWRSSTSAHNAALSTATEIGVPAAVLLVVYLVQMYLDATRLQQRSPTALSGFCVAAVAITITLSLAEMYLLAIHSMQWIVCVAIAVLLRRRLDAA